MAEPANPSGSPAKPAPNYPIADALKAMETVEAPGGASPSREDESGETLLIESGERPHSQDSVLNKLLNSPAPAEFRGSGEVNHFNTQDNPHQHPPVVAWREPEEARFSLKEPLGRGGFGEVLSAVQLSLGRTVAVKRILQLPANSDDTHRRKESLFARRERMFRHEALVTANLPHPNIVPVYDLAIGEDGRQQLAMKLVSGVDWSEVLESDAETLDGETYLARHVQTLIQVGQAVAFAHSQGIIHRDLKPRQVMIGEYGEVLLMDWGLAVIFDQGLLSAETLGAFGKNPPLIANAASPAGTPSYMAPEQTLPTSRELGPWTDIFLLGGILYRILTGMPPNQDVNNIAELYQLRERPVEPVHQRAPDRMIPNDLAVVAMKALDLDPKKRHATAKEFIAELQEHMAGTHRRRESLAITERVAESFDTSRGDYREHSHNLALLSTAETMWPANHLVTELRERILQAFIQDAIANRDFTLGKLLIDQMPQGSAGEELGRQIDAGIREYKADRRRKARTVWTLAAVLILVVIAAAFREVQLSARIAELETATTSPSGAPR